MSPQFLARNHAYKDVFQKCVGCGKYSLKPVGLKQMKNPLVDARDANERKCGICGYTHVKNLVVYNDVTTNEQYGLNIEIIKKGRILEENKEQKDNDSNS